MCAEETVNEYGEVNDDVVVQNNEDDDEDEGVS